MNDNWSWILAGGAGLALGAIFFGGLWWTVRKGLSSTRPALWFFASMLLRMVVALTGFYLIGGAHFERLLACLLGFLAARCMVIRLSRRLEEKQSFSAPEVSDAS
jgi:F1F0 ATPase subunit 2